MRHDSNIFAMFDQRQIAEFKEAFSFVDLNNDGLIDQGDLKETLLSLGRPVGSIEGEIAKMVTDMPPGSAEAINFTLYLAMMGDRMQGTDSAEDLLKAFQLLDVSNTGKISISELRKFLMTFGDRLSDDEFEQLMRGIPVDSDSCIQYQHLVDALTHASIE